MSDLPKISPGERRSRSTLQVLGRKLLASVLLAAPVGVYVSGGAKLSERKLDPQSCIVAREINLLGLLSLRIDSYSEACAEAEALLSMMAAAQYRNPPDIGMMATAITAWRRKYPDVDSAAKEVGRQLKISPDQSELAILAPPSAP